MKPQSLSDFLLWEPEPSKVLLSDGLLYEETRLLLYGRYKSFKSLIVSRLMIAFANGDEWLGFKTHPEGIKVIYLQIELSHKMLQVRVKKMMENVGKLKVEPYLWTEHFIKLDTELGIQFLRETIEELQPEVIIIDPVYKILAGNILDAISVQKLLDNLDMLIAQYHLSVVLVSHTRKSIDDEWGSDDLMGSSLFSNWCDTIIKVSREGKGMVKAKFEVVRHAEVELEPRLYTVNSDLSFGGDSDNFKPGI